MLSKMKRALTLLLCLLTVASTATACGNHTDDPKDTDNQTTAAEETETVDEAQEALDAIGEINWGGGDFTVLYTQSYAREIGDITDEKGSVLDEAVHERNTLFEERCNLTYAKVGKPYTEVNAAITAAAMTADNDYQFFTNLTDQTATVATSGGLYNFLDFENIDFEKPWWDQGILSFQLAGNVFFMSGAHNVGDNDLTYAVIYNKAIGEDHRFPDLYAAVDNGDWTIDYFLQLAQGISTDNGDGRWDELDTYGVGTTYIFADMLFYGANMRYIETDPDTDMPRLALTSGNLEKTVNILDLAQRIVHEDHTTYMWNTVSPIHPKELFKTGQLAFMADAIGALPEFNASMEDDYGVLPVPKYDKAQTEYYTYAHGSGSTLSIPVSIKNAEELEKVLEAYVILSHQLVSPAYYEIILGTRAVRDVKSAEILDMLFCNRVYDMPQYYSQFGLSNLLYESMQSNQDNFISNYEKTARRFDRTVEQLFKKLQND